MDENPDMELEVRVGRLESIAYVGNNLKRSVDRLGDGASALSEALIKVDRQQQTLTRLSHTVKDVENKLIPRDEQERKEREMRDEATILRRETVKRVVLVTTAFLVTLAIIGAFSVNYVKQRNHEAVRACRESNHARQSVRDFLQAVASESTNTAIRQSASTVINELPLSDCDKLK